MSREQRLGSDSSPETGWSSEQELSRKSLLTLLFQDKFYESVVNLTTRSIDYNLLLGANVHGPADAEEILEVEKKALEHEDVLAAIESLKLPEGAVVCADPWIYGA